MQRPFGKPFRRRGEYAAQAEIAVDGDKPLLQPGRSDDNYEHLVMD
jgi:hypothetical protein